ncbi:DNA polymerase III subunit delta' [Aquibaculum sediminis]|uniref:DNA polymerase III subunit delta' n=1 Tax=Aquibaculum sediminis TaxID=3231907 RepID=UPI003456F51C
MSRGKARQDSSAEAPAHPRQTAELLGQQEAEQRLLRAYQSGRLPHAWLLTGPRGIGKATLAYRFARFLLSRDEAAAAGPALFETAPTESLPDGLALAPDHPVFRRVAAQSHADLLSIERRARDDGKLKRDIDVESIRHLNSFLHMTAAEGGWRVGIVDTADEMNVNAANALLKVLEEPPANAVLLLVSHAPGRLLPTIRSRCRRLALKPLEGATVLALLERELPEADPGQRLLLARLGEGSIGRALELAEEGGADLYEGLLTVLADAPRLDPVTSHAFAESVARDASGRRLRTLSDLLLWWLGRLIQTAARGQENEALVPQEEGLAQRLLARGTLAQWLTLWENLERLFSQAERASLDRKQVVLTALDRLAAVTAARAV